MSSATQQPDWLTGKWQLATGNRGETHSRLIYDIYYLTKDYWIEFSSLSSRHDRNLDLRLSSQFHVKIVCISGVTSGATSITIGVTTGGGLDGGNYIIIVSPMKHAPILNDKKRPCPIIR